MIDLRALHQQLRALHGPQGWWWPGEEPFEIAVGAVLVQRSRWEQAAAAITALRETGTRHAAAAASRRRARELPTAQDLLAQLDEVLAADPRGW